MRHQLLAKVHLAAKQLGFDDDAYRAFLAAHTGKASAKELSDRQLKAIIEAFKKKGWKDQPKRAGTRPLAGGEVAAKLRALWLALYHLGEVKSPEEATLDAFIKRQTGVDSLRFLSAREAAPAIEALKAWCARVGFEAPAAGDGSMTKIALLKTLWRRYEPDAENADPLFWRLAGWCCTVVGAAERTLAQLTPHELDRCIEALAKALRSRLARRAQTQSEVA